MDPAGGVRHVSTWLEFVVTSPAALALQIAASRSAGTISAEVMEVTVDGVDQSGSVCELSSAGTGRTHLIESPPGLLRIHYRASVTPAPPHSRAHTPEALQPDDGRIVALRQSRYCPSDALGGFAAAEFRAERDRPDLASFVASWVFERLVYEARFSSHLDTAVETLVKNEGVCRDFAHVTIALCRALGIPARLASVYAPGLTPMDFHAVAEVFSDGAWQVLDATRLAPRPSLVRIATGRDAADTAFATTVTGEVELTSIEVAAVIDGALPHDDHVEVFSLA